MTQFAVAVANHGALDSDEMESLEMRSGEMSEMNTP